jgi:hypothetical protein
VYIVQEVVMKDLSEVMPKTDLAPAKEKEEDKRKLNLTEVGPAGRKIAEAQADSKKVYLRD